MPSTPSVTYVPEADAARVVDALAAAGAGRLGDYERCAFVSAGTGTFSPLPGAHPALGRVGERASVAEARVEMVLARHRRAAVVAALRAAHPYEEPAFALHEQARSAGSRGLGRVGSWPAAGTLRDLAAHVGDVLPATPHGVRVGGDLDRTVRTVAVCGGAGDDLFGAVRASGADAYVTADLRHHPASEALEHGAPGLVDVSHWASEWPWLADCERLLRDRLARVCRYGGDACLAPRDRPLGRPDGRRRRHRRDPEEPALKAAAADQVRLLDLQALDTRLAQLAHRRRTLPEHAALAELESELSTLRDQIVVAETEQSDLGRELSKAEGDVDQVRSRAERDQKRLDAGQVSSPKELESLQHEIATLARRQSALEEIVLDVMERLESSQSRSSELTMARETCQARVVETTAARDTTLAEIDAQATQLQAQRATQAGALDDGLIALYEKIRDQQGGVGAAELRQRRCGGCRLELNNVEINRLRDTDPDEVMRCEECRRILVRTAESGL